MRKRFVVTTENKDVVYEGNEETIEPKSAREHTCNVCEIRMNADSTIETANRSITAKSGNAVRISRNDLILMHGAKSGDARIIDALTGKEILGWCSLSANFEQILDLVKGDNT